MKVILLADLKGTGKKDQIIDVSEGYARNFLFPKKLAVEATATNLNSINIQKGAQMHRKDVEKQEAQALAQRLSGVTVKIKAKCGENGKLFGAITNKEVAQALKSEMNVTLDKKKIEVPSIKSIGTFTAEARVYADVSTTFNVIIEKLD